MSVRSVLLVCLASLACAVGTSAVLAAPPDPSGSWRTFDDNGRESGEVRLFVHEGLLYGQVTAIRDPAKANAVCAKCADDRKDKPVIGLQIMRGLKPDGAKWDGGQIVDPANGSVYDCSVRVEDNGQTLVVRGYLGLSLLGRSQTWKRAG